MSAPRFYLPELPASGTIELDPASQRHARNVLRLAVGDTVVIFDGSNHEARGTIISADKRSMLVQIESHSECSRELELAITVYASLPKGDRQKVLVDGLTQLGVSQLVPLNCERSVAQPTSSAVERLQRGVIETSKQCGRNQLMEIRGPVNLSDLTAHRDCSCFFLHPYGESQELWASDLGSCRAVQLLIGPEGGLTEAECDHLREMHWHQLSLGSRILRVEMAALASVAGITTHWAATTRS